MTEHNMEVREDHRPLWRHQRAIMRWSQTPRGPRTSLPLFLQMRLGKTIVSTRWADGLPPGPRLVVSPLSVAPNWMDELVQEGHTPTNLYSGSKKERTHRWSERIIMFDDAQPWFVTNWDMLKSRELPTFITEGYWVVVILDESVHIKNPKAATTKNVLKHLTRVPYRCILSGNPKPENDLEIFPQMQFVHGGTWLGFRNFWDFRAAGCLQTGGPGGGWQIRKSVAARMEIALAESAYRLSRRDAGMYEEKIFQTRHVELPAKVRAAYNELERNWVLGDQTFKYAAPVHTKLRRLAGGTCGIPYNHPAKLNELESLIRNDLSDARLLIWTPFINEITRIGKLLSELGVSHSSVRGITPPLRRREINAKFQEGKLQAVVIQSRTGMYGLDWSAADTAIYYGLDWSGNAWTQSQDRLVHKNRKTPCHYVVILAQDTVDEDAYEALRYKKFKGDAFINHLIERARSRWAA